MTGGKSKSLQDRLYADGIKDKKIELPVCSISFGEVENFVDWLNQVASNRPGQASGRYGIPSALQWEYAARAKSRTLYSFGSEAVGNLLTKYGVVGKRYSGLGSEYDTLERSGQRLPNRWGLFDTTGNVAGICEENRTRVCN